MRWLLVLAVVALPALGAEIGIEGELALGGTFRVVVRGVPEEGGRATILNLRSGEALQVELSSHAGSLRSAPVYAWRACGEVWSEPGIVVELGDTLVAASNLGGGLAVAAQVGPRSRGADEPGVVLERWEDVDRKWVPAQEMEPALFRIVLADSSQDVTCGQDVVDLPVALAGKEFVLPLTEEAPTAGKFVGQFVLALEPRMCELWLRVTTVDEKLLAEAPVPAGACLVCQQEGVELRAALARRPLSLAPADLAIPVGCVGEVRVEGVARPDEVRWCVDGAERLGGLALNLFADDPREVKVVALARHGLLWERAESTVVFVPRVKLSVVDAATGLWATEPWPCTQPVQVHAEHVSGDSLIVLVGKLGPDPRVQELTLGQSPDGLFLSPPLRPSDLAACSGDVLWVQFRDPRGCYSAYVTLPLR